MAISALDGIWIGSSANLYKRMEDSARVGVNRVLTTVSQAASLFNSLYIAELAMKAVSSGIPKSIHTVAKVAICLTPVVTNILCAKLSLTKNPRLKRAAIVINNHIGTVCQIAVVVSSVALIAFGQPILGSVSLAFVVLGFAQRCCWLPLRVSHSVDIIGFFGTNAARIVLGDPFYKFIAVCEVANFAYLQIVHYRKGLPKPVETKSPTILITNAPESYRTSVDSRHMVREAIIPPAPDIDLKTLNGLFEKIDFENLNNRKILNRIVTDDEHWKEFYGDKNSDDELFKHVEKGLNNFIENVTNRTIKDGSIYDYRSLQARAKHIANQLPLKSKEDQLINLIHLSLASYYCPAGYLEKVRSIYYTLCNAVEEDSLKARVDQILGDARRHLFQSFLYNLFIVKKNPFRHLIDIADNHIYNEYINFLGDRFKLSETEDAQQDALSCIDILSKKILGLIYQPLIKPFTQQYNQIFISKTIAEALKNIEIPHALMEKWFVDEYLEVIHLQKLPISNVSQRDYNARLIKEAEGWVRDNVYDVMTGLIEEKYLTFFLLKMGVLKQP